MATTLSQEERNELRRLALAAKPGPWWQKSHECPTAPSPDATELSSLLCFFADEGEPRFWDWINNGKYVAAANPQTMLALLDQIDALEASRLGA